MGDMQALTYDLSKKIMAFTGEVTASKTVVTWASNYIK